MRQCCRVNLFVLFILKFVNLKLRSDYQPVVHWMLFLVDNCRISRQLDHQKLKTNRWKSLVLNKRVDTEYSQYFNISGVYFKSFQSRPFYFTIILDNRWYIADWNRIDVVKIFLKQEILSYVFAGSWVQTL